MNITFEKNKDLTSLNSFHLNCKAKLYASYKTIEELKKISFSNEFMENEVLNLGEGCNILFNGDYDGLVLHSEIKGIKRYDKDKETVYVIAGSGEKWPELVKWSVSEGLSGIENLTDIPGSVGAAPVQNIGAYGCEIASVIHTVECFDVITHNVVTLTAEECKFGYRDSIFKHEGKGKYIITRVSLKLKNSKTAENLSYGPLKKLEEKLGRSPNIEEVSAEISKIRSEKLPDPTEKGNAGSFFKNPVVRIFFYREVMCTLAKDIPYYETDDPYYIKIPAGWLIEHAGLKGLKIGGAEVYPKQCLVIANTGKATAKDILELSKHVRDTVIAKFGVELRPEVNIADTSIKVTVLGSGTSKGIPEIGCYCPVCRSEDPRDKRSRCSILVETQGVRLLVDVSPDFHDQAIHNDITYVDAALITHNHYDHVGGFDDLRPFCRNGKFPVYLRADVNADLHRRIDYCFREHLYPGVPSFEMNEIDNTPFLVKGVKIIPVTVMHGKVPIIGFRIGKFAYITDAKTIPEEELEKLKGLDTLILNGLRWNDHFAHFTVDEALEMIAKIKPRHAYLTHFCHEVGKHSDLEKRLPENVKPCFDGMTLIIK